MRINHNIAALNTYNQLSANNAKSSNSLEKLSSGLRINRAGDDAAGLAISEKMRGQIRGLEQASRNAQDGISLIQTAEGALNETHAILQRMRELAVQSANDTNDSPDRTAIQEEVDQLAAEIDRIANTTEFNKQKLLNGSLSNKNLQIGANEDQNLEISISKMDSSSTGLNIARSSTSATVDEVSVIAESNEVLGANAAARASNINTGGYTQSDDLDIKVKVTTAPDATAGSEVEAIFEVTVNGVTKTIETGSHAVDQDLTLDGTNFDIFESGQSVVIDAQAAWSLNDEYNIEITGQKTDGGPDVSSYTNAKAAVTTIETAISSVSAERSKLGAYQNRLEHTINNLGTSAENLTAAESRIRDVDMAAEMMAFTKNNILTQAAQAMLAQANQQPQGVLQLLR